MRKTGDIILRSAMNPEDHEQIDQTPVAIGQPLATVIDEEIFCPVCNYNLTGSLGGRCSECGSLYDRDSLIAAQKANAITLIPWDHPQPMPAALRFWKTLDVVLSRPRRFALVFSVQPHQTKARSFMIGVLGVFFALSAGLFLVHDLIEYFRPTMGISASQRLKYWSIGLFVPFGAALGAAATVPVTAAWLWVMCPHHDGRRHFGPWSAIARYASAHYLIGCVFFPVALAIDLFVGEALGLLVCTVALGLVVSGLLAACTVGAVIEKRAAPSLGRSVAFLGMMITFTALPIVLASAGIAFWAILVKPS